MGFKKRKNIELYRSLEDLSIYRFDKIIHGDLRYLSKKENVTNVKISNVYNEVWKGLYNDYAAKTNNNTTIRVYLLLGEINYLSLRYKIVPELIDVALSSTDLDIFKMAITEIKSWGFSMDMNNPIVEETNKIIKALNNSITKIKRKRAEYKELTKKEEKALSIIQQKVKLERVIGIKVDIKKDSVLDWLAYWDEFKIIIDQKEKANVK